MRHKCMWCHSACRPFDTSKCWRKKELIAPAKAERYPVKWDKRSWVWIISEWPKHIPYNYELLCKTECKNTYCAWTWHVMPLRNGQTEYTLIQTQTTFAHWLYGRPQEMQALANDCQKPTKEETKRKTPASPFPLQALSKYIIFISSN